MRIVIDTNVLFDVKAMQALGTEEAELVLPAVAFAERVRQVLRRGGNLEEVWRVLDLSDIKVEEFGAIQALTRDLQAIGDREWGRLARDAFIAGHVGPEDILWTRDVADFVAVGVPRRQIKDTATL